MYEQETDSKMAEKFFAAPLPPRAVVAVGGTFTLPESIGAQSCFSARKLSNKVGKADERHSSVTPRKIVGGTESLNSNCYSIQHRLTLIYVDGILYARKSRGITGIPNPHMMRGH
jgi:hypothetical protein